MEDPKRRDVGLFRYSIAREPADPRLSKAERGELVRVLAAEEHTAADGSYVRFSRSTIDRWVRDLRRGGFEALVPVQRHCEPRTAKDVLALAEALKREAPARTAAQVVRIMESTGLRPPSERTIQRLYARLGLYTSTDGCAPRAYGRFGATRRNERWMGDALHGPVVAGRKAYLLHTATTMSAWTTRRRSVCGSNMTPMRPKSVCSSLPGSPSATRTVVR